MDEGRAFEEYVGMINPALYSAVELTGEQTDRVAQAMLYSLENGGKRIRPVLVLEFCRATGGKVEDALPFALAIEMIHTYSLIHDDLPCMDDDDMRRGKPSCHKRFDYATALLAGDGLLTLAFGQCARAALDPAKVSEAVAVLTDAAGYLGMIGGQTMDLQNEGRAVTVDDLRRTDALKTSCLIKAACLLGCIASGAGAEQRRLAERYAEDLGLAFQIVDDLLDLTCTSEQLGKPVGSDTKNDKSTYPALLGIERCEKLVEELTASAMAAAEGLGDGGFLRDLALRLAKRKN